MRTGAGRRSWGFVAIRVGMPQSAYVQRLNSQGLGVQPGRVPVRISLGIRWGLGNPAPREDDVAPVHLRRGPGGGELRSPSRMSRTLLVRMRDVRSSESRDLHRKKAPKSALDPTRWIEACPRPTETAANLH